MHKTSDRKLFQPYKPRERVSSEVVEKETRILPLPLLWAEPSIGSGESSKGASTQRPLKIRIGGRSRALSKGSEAPNNPMESPSDTDMTTPQTDRELPKIKVKKGKIAMLKNAPKAG